MVSVSFLQAEVAPLGSIRGWEDFLKEGDAYLSTAFGAHAKKRRIFTPEILYNIIAMAIEKFSMAALMYHGALPYNHTMADLVQSLDEVFGKSLGDIGKALLNFDKYQEICDIDAFKIVPPDSEDIPWMLDVAREMQLLVKEKLVG